MRGETKRMKKAVGGMVKGAGWAAFALGAGAAVGCQTHVLAGSGGPAAKAGASQGVAPCQGADCGPAAKGAPSLRGTCTGGDPRCDPESNGLGVYVARDNRFCLPTRNRNHRFCPEAFVNDAAGVSIILYNAAQRDAGLQKAPVYAVLRQGAFGLMKTQRLARISADKTRLGMKLRTLRAGAQPVDTIASDEQLAAIGLRFEVETPGERPTEYSLRIRHLGNVPTGGTGAQGVLERYAVEFDVTGNASPGAADWKPACFGKKIGEGAKRALKTSFLAGWQVDDISAKVAPDAQAVTMSCETGAIDTCIEWGYAPWGPGAGDGPASGGQSAEREALFGACLQAKRAAYFVGEGDYKSYTKSGTHILLHDGFGVRRDPIDAGNLEAIWTANGASCLNWNNRRAQETFTDSAYEQVLPACAPSAFPGVLSTGIPPAGANATTVD